MYLFSEELQLTAELTLSIESSQAVNRKETFRQMYLNRGKAIPKQEFFYGLQQEQEEKIEIDPYFFENSRYTFYFYFDESVTKVTCLHPSASVVEGFKFNHKRQIAILDLLTANNIGWFTLPFAYEVEIKGQKQVKTVVLRFAILATKIDMQKDLAKIEEEIKEHYPMWLYSFNLKTERHAQKVKVASDSLPLFWLARFKHLHRQFFQALKGINNSPHKRLQTFRQQKTLGQLEQEEISSGLEEFLALALKEKNYKQTFTITSKSLSANTPENRFVKFAVHKCSQQLSKLHKLLEENSDYLDLSFSYLQQIQTWIRQLQSFIRLPFMQQVGLFKGFSQLSLALQQRPSYSRFYAIWRELDLYLELLADQDNLVATKSISELYEVWCLLKIKQILLLDLGFNETTDATVKHLSSKNLEQQILTGKNHAFTFSNNKGIKINLYYERVFHPLAAALGKKCPDICLEVNFPDRDPFIFLFDAKYRIAERQGNLVPEDALIKMHYYRDAIVIGSNWQKQRPVFGAFALYPGYFRQKEEVNPYQEAIAQTWIGAFALLPEVDGDLWLKDFLHNILNSNSKKLDEHLALLNLHPANRINAVGRTQSHLNDLTLILAPTVNTHGEQQVLYKLVKNGEQLLRYYLITKDFFKLPQNDYLMQEIRFIGIFAETGKRSLDMLYPVIAVEEVNLQAFQQKLQAMTVSSSFSDLPNLSATSIVSVDSVKDYYCFTLSPSFNLPYPIDYTSEIGQVQYTRLTSLLLAPEELPTAVYPFLSKDEQW